ncbi:hypothetical protein O1611_g2088 [Lasiodiplodia mahajangana]|uniref:Uncharacterized protein n=1 Tax=Lasiodiplodia mahajangana TaxID=1108764 RepID=A0ACC2JVV1_9PEZI|nr:hypothetical protein O1611_g2088 [Lasiodiplodia mahajangana]
MADPLSLSAVGAIGVAAAFKACIDCFDYVQRGRHFGRDFQTSTLLLTGAKLRLACWGKAVYVDKDPLLGKPDATPEELRMAEDSLLQILTLFTDTEKIKKKHGLSAKANRDLTTLTDSPVGRDKVAEPGNAMKEMSIKRQKSSSFIRLTSWAMCDKSEFAELLADITALIENLERIFPPPKPRPELPRGEAAQNSREPPLQSSRDASYEAGRMVPAVSLGHRSGHFYNDVTIRGKAHMGDELTWETTSEEGVYWTVCEAKKSVNGLSRRYLSVSLTEGEIITKGSGA